MHNYDDINFECRQCGETKYRASATDRIALLVRPQANGGWGRPTCPVCGRVSIPNNGGYACIHCSAYYELPVTERPPRIMLMPSRREHLPTYLAVALVLLAGDLVVAGALFFGGWAF